MLNYQINMVKLDFYKKLMCRAKESKIALKLLINLLKLLKKAGKINCFKYISTITITTLSEITKSKDK